MEAAGTASSPSLSLLLLLLLLLATPASSVSKNIACDSEVQTNVCLHKNYSSMDIPINDRANKILIEIHISDVLKINDRDFSITFSLYFNVQWQEPRLHLNPSFYLNRTMDEDLLNPVDLYLINDLWVPNVFIYNLKTFKVIDVLSKLAGLWVNSKREIMYSQASQITFICPMIFNYFPLDTQVCKFQVGSYSYNMEKMIFEVTHLGYAHTSRGIVLDYDIQIHRLKEEDKIFVGGALGNYSLAGFEMILVRHVSHYIINYYLPSGLFVVVSWISFLVPSDIIPGRMALLVTLFLVLVNIFNTVTTNTPKAEGLTAIEAWMLACILFVFGTLIEYAGLLFSHGFEDDEMSKGGDGGDSLDESDGGGGERLFDQQQEQVQQQAHLQQQQGGQQVEMRTLLQAQGKDMTYSSLLSTAGDGATGRDQQPPQPGSPGCVAASGGVAATGGVASGVTLDAASFNNPSNDFQHVSSPMLPTPTPQQQDFESSKKGRNGASSHPGGGRFSRRDKGGGAALRRRKRHARIDRFFLVFFPCMFLFFNLVYWSVYIFGQEEGSFTRFVNQLLGGDGDGGGDVDHDTLDAEDDSAKSNWI